MAVIRTYRDLIAWQKGMKLSKAIYIATQSMPREEQFGLTSQMRRAAVSIPSNIAEGYALESKKAYLKHLRISRGSLAELQTQWELVTVELELIPFDRAILALLEEEDRILQGLIRAVRASRSKR
ncbi:four helix bundle protein [Humisphaera borealis]|uniref:four helix bundle protein n=1 Tax=Humisphaera borealis TaxID=2807512 RepID=UPI0028F3F27C|nr:four helix bundle protein [Humisphaera borealis]